jgi:hypothetical protein
MIPQNAIKKAIKFTVFVALSWLFIATLLILWLVPELPHSNSGWLIFLAFGPPLYALGELFFGWLFSANHGFAISSCRFSLKRVCIALPLVVLTIAHCWPLTRLLVGL